MRSEEVPQNSSMAQPQVQFYLEKVSNLGMEKSLSLVNSDEFGPIE